MSGRIFAVVTSRTCDTNCLIYGWCTRNRNHENYCALQTKVIVIYSFMALVIITIFNHMPDIIIDYLYVCYYITIRSGLNRPGH